MKKVFLIAVIASFMACDNSADTKNDKDSSNVPGNTSVYDSFSGKRGGDTSSYEQMPNKISDSTP